MLVFEYDHSAVAFVGVSTRQQQRQHRYTGAVCEANLAKVKLTKANCDLRVCDAVSHSYFHGRQYLSLSFQDTAFLRITNRS